MSVNPWDDLARRSRELYERQTEVAKSWLGEQNRLADTLAKAGSAGDGAITGQEAAAMAELWRSWLALGGSLGAALPGMAGVLELWLQVQQAARSYEAVVAGAWA